MIDVKVAREGIGADLDLVSGPEDVASPPEASSPWEAGPGPVAGVCTRTTDSVTHSVRRLFELRAGLGGSTPPGRAGANPGATRPSPLCVQRRSGLQKQDCSLRVRRLSRSVTRAADPDADHLATVIALPWIRERKLGLVGGRLRGGTDRRIALQRAWPLRISSAARAQIGVGAAPPGRCAPRRRPADRHDQRGDADQPRVFLGGARGELDVSAARRGRRGLGSP